MTRVNQPPPERFQPQTDVRSCVGFVLAFFDSFCWILLSSFGQKKNVHEIHRHIHAALTGCDTHFRSKPKGQRGRERKGPPEIIQKVRLRNRPISSADFPMNPM